MFLYRHYMVNMYLKIDNYKISNLLAPALRFELEDSLGLLEYIELKERTRALSYHGLYRATVYLFIAFYYLFRF